MFEPSKEWSIKYWSTQLTRTSERADPILKKLNLNLYEPLTTEETFLVRELLMEYGGYARLLASDVARPDPTPPPLWKKLFRKK